MTKTPNTAPQTNYPDQITGDKPQPGAEHAVNAAPISAVLRRLPGLSEQDAGLLEQAASMLEGLHNDEHNRGNCSTAEGAACSADAVRRLAVQLLRAAESAPCLHQIAEPEGLADVSKEQYARMFGAACDALGQISDHLGIDSDLDPGAEPIIEAIDELRAAALQAAPPAPADVAVPDAWRELSRRLYVELFHCDQQMTQATDEYGDPMWQQGSTVSDVLRDAKAALAAAPAQAQKPMGTAHLPYFSYDEDEGVQFWATQARATKECQDAIDTYRGDVEDGWPDNVESVRWGVVLGRAVKTDERSDGSCDYALTSYAAPAQAVAVPNDAVAAALIRLDVIYREEAGDGESRPRPDWLAEALRLVSRRAQEHATQLAGQGQTFAQWWDEQRKTAAERAPGDDWMDLNADDRDQYEAAFSAGKKSAAHAQAQEDARDSVQAIDAAAKAIAKGLDYPWEYMTKEGHANMHEVAATALTAARAAQGGA